MGVADMADCPNHVRTLTDNTAHDGALEHVRNLSIDARACHRLDVHLPSAGCRENADQDNERNHVARTILAKRMRMSAFVVDSRLLSRHAFTTYSR